MKLKNVTAVIILYNPNFISLKQSLTALKNQIGNVVLVDNTSDNKKNIEFLKDFQNQDIDYISLGKNEGIAKAQNVGINYASEQSAEYVLIMDQDSVASEEMALHLMNDLNFLKDRGFKIGAIGPTPINIQTQKPYSSRIKKNYPLVDERPDILKVSELISSGSLISLATFKNVGLMDETLFIDGVDHEWCWRAKSNGYDCAISQKAHLQHMLGEGDKKIFGIRIAITSPFRVFYQFRNYFYLSRRKYVPMYWKINNGFKYLIKMLYYPTFVSPRKLYLKNIFRGIKAGLSGNI